jgi:hypothetical protein
MEISTVQSDSESGEEDEVLLNIIEKLGIA